MVTSCSCSEIAMLDSTSHSWRLNCIREEKPSFLWAFTFQKETRPIDQFLLHNVSEVWDQVRWVSSSCYLLNNSLWGSYHISGLSSRFQYLCFFYWKPLLPLHPPILPWSWLLTSALKNANLPVFSPSGLFPFWWGEAIKLILHMRQLRLARKETRLLRYTWSLICSMPFGHFSPSSLPTLVPSLPAGTLLRRSKWYSIQNCPHLHLYQH